MKMLRKYLSLTLCLCIFTYSMPSFAQVSPVYSEHFKVELSDDVMAQIFGASGHVDAQMADYKVAGSQAEAVLANRSTLYCQYTLNVIDANGVVLEALASGTLEPNAALIVTGTATVASNSIVQARLWNNGVPGLESKDTSWAVQ